jgi:hypothetical protein
MTMRSPRDDRSMSRVPRARIGRAARWGFSLLEFEVAIVLFGIAVAGMYPLAVMHSRGLTSLEQRYAIQGNWYLAPSIDQWARKLGAPASLSQQDPGALPTPPNWIVDDDDVVGYADVGGTWTRESNSQALAGFDRRHPAPPTESPTTPETDHAAWLFENVTPGWYYVEATWTAASDQATDAQYVFYDGAASLNEAPLTDQTIAPTGASYGGRPWQILATRYFRNGSATVQLNGQATGYLIADGVRLVPVENDVQILSLERSLGGEAVTAHVSINSPVP